MIRDELVLYGAARIRPHFERDRGKSVNTVASGFWMLADGGTFLFVTNRHVVDPALAFGEATTLRLADVELETRAAEGSETTFASVVDFQRCMFLHEDADVAIFANPPFSRAMHIGGALLPEQMLATPDYFRKLRIGWQLTFVGFPGHGQPWWDEEWNLPIARQASIASLPWKPYVNKSVKSTLATDILLVSGLSFSGSSGSIVGAVAHGLPPGGDIVDPAYVPGFVVGIMSGHWWESDIERAPDMLRQHAGLSYLTRSTAILNLIAEARAFNWRRAG